MFQNAITGDSYFHEAEIDFLRDVDMAIIDSGYIEDQEIVQLAVLSRARTIVCLHLYREIDKTFAEVSCWWRVSGYYSGRARSPLVCAMICLRWLFSKFHQ